MHLSMIEVTTGNKFRKGSAPRTFRANRRVTGLHLHMRVRWNGAYLDTTTLLELTLPKLSPENRKAEASPRDTARAYSLA